MKQLFSAIDKRQQKNLIPAKKKERKPNVIILTFSLETISIKGCQKREANQAWWFL